MDITILDSLGEDLVLLSFDPDRRTRDGPGPLATAQMIGYGLMGSELVRLAARGRVAIEAGHVVVRDAAPVGDAELDAALDSLIKAKQPVQPKKWVNKWRRGITQAYLMRLASSGAVRAESRRFAGTRWLITEPARVADARARLDAIAFSTGQVDVTKAALGGLAHAIRLDFFLYPGNRSALERMQQIALGQWTVDTFTGATASDAVAVAAQASFRAVVQEATNAAIWGVNRQVAANQASSLG